MRLQNKVAVITGAASGIGLATAVKFAQEGAFIAICDLNQAGIDAAIKEVEAVGGQALGYIVDVTKPDQIAAMRDVPEFIRKAQAIYGYSHFVNDVGGSLCELDEPSVIELLAEHTLILYIQVTTKAEEQKLIDRARSDPKPLYYRPEFLQEQLAIYLAENGLQYAAQMEPDAFTRWIFPRLFHSRIPRYEAIAREHGYTVTSEEVARVRNEADFDALIETAIARN